MADSDAKARSFYRQSLTGDGCDVIEACDGRDALVKALVRQPSLVITELRLPIIDGFALCEILRHDRTTADVPILVVTAETRPARLQRARRAGANIVLAKQATPSVLLGEARQLLLQSQELRGRAIAARVNADTHLEKISRAAASFRTPRPSNPLEGASALHHHDAADHATSVPVPLV